MFLCFQLKQFAVGLLMNIMLKRRLPTQHNVNKQCKYNSFELKNN